MNAKTTRGQRPRLATARGGATRSVTRHAPVRVSRNVTVFPTGAGDADVTSSKSDKPKEDPTMTDDARNVKPANNSAGTPKTPSGFGE